MKNREPVLNAAVVVAIVTAGIAMLAAFGLPITPEQTQAVIAFVSVVAPLAVAFLARKKVTPLSDPRNSAGERLTPDAEEIPDVQQD